MQNGGSFHDLPATLGVGNPNKKSNASVPTFSKNSFKHTHAGFSAVRNPDPEKKKPPAYDVGEGGGFFASR